MKYIYLHIGFHKTGTTYIQNFLSLNSEYISNQGYLYPESGRDLKIGHGHHLVPWKFMKKQPCFEFSNLFKEIESSDCQSVLISSEEFEFCLSYIQEIKEVFSNYCVKVIVYLRRQDRYIESNYNQCIKQGSFSGSIKEFCQLMMKQKTLYYYNFCSQWGKVFGKENLIVRNFESQKSNLIEDFFKITGLTDFSSKEIDRLNIPNNSNVSVDMSILPALRVLSKLKDTIGEAQYKKIRNKFIQEQKVKQEIKQTRKTSIIPYGMRKKIIKKYEESNHKLLEFLDDLSGLTFDENHDLNQPYLNVNLMDCQLVLDLYNCLFENELENHSSKLV